MKKIGLIIKNDFIQGILLQWKKYLLVVIVSFVVFIDFILRIRHGIQNETIVNVKSSIADGLIYLFKGVREFQSGTNIQFDLPTAYILLNVLLAFIIGNYAVKDLYGYGKDILIRCRNKKHWWISKCVWNICSVTLFYVVIWIVLLIVNIVAGKISLQPTEQICYGIIGLPQSMESEMTINSGIQQLQKLFVIAVVLPLLTSMAISAIQMTLAFVLSPIVSYICVIAFLIAGAFFNHPFLLGNYFMLLRSDLIISEGYNVVVAVFIDVVFVCLSFVGGYLFFKKTDLLENQRM